MTRRAVAGALTLATALLASCAKPPGAPQPPESGEYLFPSWPAGELRPDQERRIDKAWRSLLAGDATAAERELQKALQRDPGLVPAATALAYARLAQGRIAEAAGGFEDVLRRRTDYVPAVAGAAQAAQRAGDTEAALRLYQRAQSLAPDNPLLRRRLAEVPVQQQIDTAARSAGSDVEQTPGRHVAEVYGKIGHDQKLIFFGDHAGLLIIFGDGRILVAKVHLDDLLHMLVEFAEPLLDLRALGPDFAVNDLLLIIGQVHHAGEILAQADWINDSEIYSARRRD